MESLKLNPSSWKDWFAQYKQDDGNFSTKALYDYLRGGERFRFERGSRLLQILYLPSFDPTVSYEVFHLTTFDTIKHEFEKSFHLLRTIWRMDLDMKTWHTLLQPTFEFKHIPINKDVVDTLYVDFQKQIPIWFYPTVEDDYLGNDGTNYELAFGGGFLSVRYNWWSDKPDGWQPLYDAVDKAIAQFEDLLTT